MKKVIFLFMTMFLVVNFFGVQSANAQQTKNVDIYLHLWSKGAKDEGSSISINGERHFFNGKSYLSFNVPVGAQIQIEVISRGGGWLHATDYEPRYVIEPVIADFFYYVRSDWQYSTPIYIRLLDEKITN